MRSSRRSRSGRKRRRRRRQERHARPLAGAGLTSKPCSSSPSSIGRGTWSRGSAKWVLFAGGVLADGSRIAVVKNDPDTDGRDIWAFDIATGKGTAITSDAPPDSAPIWSPDGTQIAYVSDRENTNAVFRRAANGTGGEELVYKHTTGSQIILTDWSADGRFLCFWAGETMFLLPLTGERKAIELGRERGGRFSPDSRLLAFSSNQSGRFLIYVKDLAESTRGAAPASTPTAAQVSNEAAVGGIFWRRDGKELFYLSQQGGQGVMAVDVTGTAPFQAGPPKLLFKLPNPVLAPAQLSNVSSPDGERFVFAVNVAPRRAAQ